MAAAQSAHSEAQNLPAMYEPPVPETVEDTGLSEAFLEQLILKLLYFRGETLGRELSTAMGVKFSLIEPLLENFKRNQLIGVKRSLGMGNISAVFALAENGRNLAREYLEKNQYSGPVPVPLYQYAAMVRLQKLKAGWLTPEVLAEAYRHMVVTPEILSQIGPAVNSGKSFLIYGQPGNGKTYLAEALFNIQTAPIFIPFAIESQGQIVQMYDPIYHQKIDTEVDLYSALSAEPQHDLRWFQAKRPFIVTGGELSLDMLDLSFNSNSKIYDAPFQLKANNGIYLIDDFGRQKATPAEVLNRWIVPMERRVDYLSFRTGGKMSVPFEAFLVFSTNLRPDSLGDEAFLRRIQYKMLLRSPGEQEFHTIFHHFCASKGLPVQPGLIEHFINKHYRRTGKKFRRCHPRDVVTQATDIMSFERLPYQLTENVLERAFAGCFMAAGEWDE